MVKNNYRFLSLLILFLGFAAEAQENRFVVFFKDKNHSTFSIDNPEAFLSPKSIERRVSQDIAITFEDLPVSGAYLDSLKALEIKYYHLSKWFNATIIQADSSELEKLFGVSYIDSIIYVGPGGKLKNPFISNSEAQDTMVGDTEEAKDFSVDYNASLSLQQNEMLGVDAMHEQGFMGEGMLVAVFDGGFINVDEVAGFDHLFSDNRIIATKNFVANDDSVYQYNDHGTNVLSCLAGYIPEKYIGTAPNASFILCVSEDVQGEYRVEEFNWIFAAEFADSLGVDIINTSLGYSTFSDGAMNYIYEDLDGQTTYISKANAIAASKGIVLVNSAGNEGSVPWKYISAPADADSILSVGAVNNKFERASFSSVGPTSDGRLKPEVAALGENVQVINQTGSLSFSRGTSFASPLLAGLVTGFWQANPSLSNVEVINRIKFSGHKANSPNNDLGYGIPNFSRAMSQEILGTQIKNPQSFRIYPNPIINNKLYVKVSKEHSQQDMEIYLYNSAGKVIKKQVFLNDRLTEPIVIDFIDVLPGIYFINVISEKTSEAAKVVNFF